MSAGVGLIVGDAGTNPEGMIGGHTWKELALPLGRCLRWG